MFSHVYWPFAGRLNIGGYRRILASGTLCSILQMQQVFVMVTIDKS